MANSEKFCGKVVIVSGSSSGIGEGIAILFAKLGAHVVVTGRNRDNVKRVADICLSVSPKKLKPLEVIADITVDEEAKHLIESTVKEFEKIDVLVNNAGCAAMADIDDEKYMHVYEEIMRIDLRSVVYLSHLAVPHLEKTNGNIVNISSVVGFKPLAFYSAYCMAKSALDMFVKCAAVELGPKGIRVNGINSGPVKSNILQAMGFAEQANEKFAEKTKRASPLGLFGEPVHIVHSVAFLASQEASFMTGINMIVDGGLILNSDMFNANE